MKLSEDLIKDIYAYGAAGREAWKKGEIADAGVSFIKAWEILPEPREQYDLAQSMARGFVVFYRDTKQFEPPRITLTCPAPSSRVMNGTPCAVPGLCRTVTTAHARKLNATSPVARPAFEVTTSPRASGRLPHSGCLTKKCVIYRVVTS
ncbi:hypothetical protein D5R55_06915 [Burkholderia cenocepacia]|uniref:Uncharacterized protein n=1 Tax=Burkholderia cenocepacia TaxID=95486 RepID=A0A3S9N5B1_9BURK|nr:hypothetical protein D5R55_06915 [Burkholderia cenocepacia]